MQCEETTGFLMLRRCQNTADFTCAHCGKGICSEHATVLAQESPGTTSEPALQPAAAPPVPGQSVICQTCLRKQQQPAQQPQNHYYHYPRYGSYTPYYYDYDDDDRAVFDRDAAGRSGVGGEALGS